MRQSDLFKDKHFWPLFWTQACGAFNDNLFKIALITLVNTQPKGFSLAGMQSKTLQTLAVGLFILPFFLFSATAGLMADKYEKSALIRRIKFGEIVIMGVGVFGFVTGNIGLLILVLFFMGAQSTLFGPLKYSILPQHLPHNALTAANGLIEMATFLAILLGTLLGGLLILHQPYGVALISCTIMVVAVAGWLFSWKIPLAPPPTPDSKLSFNIFTQTRKQMKHARRNPVIFFTLIGISWFWFFGATLLTLMPPLASDDFKASAAVSTFMLAALSVGIGLGSILCDKLASKQSASYLVPLGAVGMTLFGLDLAFATQQLSSLATLRATTVDLAPFVSNFHGIRLFFDLFSFGVASGFYIVPLYVIMQERSDVEHRSRTIAANNIMNAAFMVVSALLILFMFGAGAQSTHVMLTVALLNIPVCALVFWKLPELVVACLQVLKLKKL